MQYCSCQPGSFIPLKMPNNRSGDDTKHLIMSELTQTPLRKNKEQQMDSKTQSLRGFFGNAGGVKHKQRREGTCQKVISILLRFGVWLNSCCHCSNFRTTLTSRVSALASFLGRTALSQTQQSHITMPGDKTLPATNMSFLPEAGSKANPTVSSQQNKDSL